MLLSLRGAGEALSVLFAMFCIVCRGGAYRCTYHSWSVSGMDDSRTRSVFSSRAPGTLLKRQ